MKKSVLAISVIALFISFTSLGQNKTLGVGVPTPNANAALHVESPTNNQGFIMPRLTTTQRTGMGALLTATDNGLMLYDTDLKTIYIWDGAIWKSTAQVAGGTKLAYPYKDSVTTNPGTPDLFALKYAGTANARVMRIENRNTTNGSSTVSTLNMGTGAAGYFQVSNATAGGTTLIATTNSNLGGPTAPVGVYGESTGTGSLGGAFWNTNLANTYPALYSRTLGVGNAARFEILNTGNSAPALVAETNGAGNAIQTSGRIQAGQFLGDGSGLTNLPAVSFPFTTSLSNANTLFDITNTGAGAAISATNIAGTVSLSATYSGPSTGGRAITAANTSTTSGFAGVFSNTNAANSFPAIQSSTKGTGPGLRVIQDATSLGGGVDLLLQNTASTALGLNVNQQGTGSAGNFGTSNTANNNPALKATSNSNTAGSAAISGSMTGTGGPAGYFEIINGTSSYSAMYGVTNGLNGAGYFQNTNAANGFSVLSGITNGTGPAGYFQNTNAANTNSILYSATNGTGTATAIRGDVTSATNTAAAVYGSTVGTGVGLYGITTGTGAAIQGYTTTGVAAIYGQRDGASNGNAGVFNITNAANSFSALSISTIGTGSAGRRRYLRATDEEGGARPHARAHQAAAHPRRHPRDDPDAVRRLDRGHQQGAPGRQRGPQAGHPGRRDPGHQLRPGHRRLQDPGQRRRDPQHPGADPRHRRRRRRGPDGPRRCQRIR